MGVKMMPIRCCLRSLTSAAGCRQCTASWRPIGPSLQSPALPVIKECAVWSVCLFPSRYRSRTPCAAKTENLVVDFGWPLKLGWRKRTFNWIFDGMSVSCWLDVQITVNRFDLKYFVLVCVSRISLVFREKNERVRPHQMAVNRQLLPESRQWRPLVWLQSGTGPWIFDEWQRCWPSISRPEFIFWKKWTEWLRDEDETRRPRDADAVGWSGWRRWQVCTLVRRPVGWNEKNSAVSCQVGGPLSTDSMTSSSPAHLHFHATATGAASAVSLRASPVVDVSASVWIGGSERILSPMDVRPSDQLKNVIHSQRNSNEMCSVLDGRNHQIKSKSISPHLSWHLTTTLKPEIINETRFSHKFKWKCPVGTGGGGMKGGKERNGRGKQKQKGERRLVNSNHNHNHNSGNIFSGPRTNELGGKSSKFSWAM